MRGEHVTLPGSHSGTGQGLGTRVMRQTGTALVTQGPLSGKDSPWARIDSEPE